MLVHLAAFSLPRLTWQVFFCVLRVKHHKSMKMRSDKCKKGGFDSLFCRFCCLRKLAPMGSQIWGMFAPIFGDLGAFLGHILLPMLGL